MQTDLRIEQLELMLRLERAKVDHMKNLITRYNETRFSKDMFKLFEYVESIK